MASPVSDVAEASGHPQTAPWSALFSGGNAWRAIALTGGVALHAINVHIVTTILPSVVKDIGGLDYYAWNVTLFVATSILGSTLTNKLLALFGPRKAYLLALLVFGAGALVCASAGDMAWMLAGRSVQGIGGGLLASLSYALIPIVFPQRLWSRAIALVSGMWGIATLLGPAVGGLFAAGGHWRWAFWALLPILLAQAVIVIAQLKGRDVRHENPRMPLLRILLLGASVLLVASAGQASDNWMKLMCLAGGALLGWWVAYMDLRHPLSLLPRNGYRLGTEMGKVFACISLLVIGSCTEIFVPYFLQTLHGYAPLAAGYMTAAMAGGWSAASLFSSGRSGAAADRMVRLGPMLMTAGLLVLALLLPAQFDAPEIVIDVLLMLALAAAGMGIGMGWPHLISRALHAAEPGEENLTSSAVTTVQLYAMAIGAALVGVVANEAGVAREGGEAHAALILFSLFAVAPMLAVWLAQRLTRQH